MAVKKSGSIRGILILLVLVPALSFGALLS